MSTLEQTSGREAPKHAGLTLPAWLDGSTIALLTAMLILGAMMQTGHVRLASGIEQLRRDVGADIEKLRVELKSVRDELKTDIGNMRNELGTDVSKLDDRLRSVEVDVAAIRVTTTGFDARVRAVEELARQPVSPPPAG